MYFNQIITARGSPFHKPTEKIYNNTYIVVNEIKILIFPDPCHMIKLIRNTLGKHKQFHRNGQLIAWRFFERLVAHKDKNKFISHKLTKEHMQWNKNEMRVCLATQTFSRSVAASMNYLRLENNIRFISSKATADFALMMNDIFDLLNSKHPESLTIFRTGLTKNSQNEVLIFLDGASRYIKSLKMGRKRVVDMRVKFGFIGFLMKNEAYQSN